MRWLLGIFYFCCLVSFTLTWLPEGRTQPEKELLPDVSRNPPRVEQAEVALKFLSSLPPEVAYYVRVLDWADVPAEDLQEWKLLLQWWLNQMSRSQTAVYLQDVPGNPRLQWLDIRQYRWEFKGWLAVAEREPYLHDASVSSPLAIALRKVTGQDLRKDLADKDKYPVLAMVTADWLFRETIESNRSTSYYDLLYGRERFGKGAVRRREDRAAAVRNPDEKVLVERQGVLREVPRSAVQSGEEIFLRGPGNTLVREGQQAVGMGEEQPAAQQGFVDFPKDIKDWDEFFGLDIVRAFGEKKEIDLDYGAVVEGGDDNPKKGSIVALHNRLLLTEPSAWSIGMRTFDVEETEGERDYSEIAPKIPLLLRQKKLRFDAGELLAYLPNGGQAAMLINKDTKRVEVAGGGVAQNTRNSRMNRGVRNPGDCVSCHGSSGGYNMPTNLIKEYHDKGLDAKFLTPEKRDRFKGFFFEWEEKVEPYQKAYNALLARTTRSFKLNAKGEKVWDKGWDGAKLTTTFDRLRNWYDDPVDAKRAAASVGYPVELLKRVAVKSPLNSHGRLVRDLEIPRSVWEKDAYLAWQKLKVVSEEKVKP